MQSEDQNDPANLRAMIIFVSVNLKQLLKHERKYPWPRPERCPRCEVSCVWGHGFVLAYFDALSGGVFLRRYRCPQCGCVMRLRPKGFFPRFQAAIATIRSCIQHCLKAGRYLPVLPLSRQRHWLNNLKRNVKAYLGDQWSRGLLAAFDHLASCGYVPVSSAI